MKISSSDKIKRKTELYDYIIENHSVTISQMAADFELSEMTIRRDLTDLEAQGMIVINRGRVEANSGTSVEISSGIKSSKMTAEKERIAKEAVKLIPEGSTIFLDSGTTVQKLAVELLRYRNLTVVTNSILVLNTLCMLPSIKVLVLPGMMQAQGMCMYDASTAGYLRNIHVDIAFLGAEAIDISAGAMVPDLDDRECKRLLIQNSRQTVLLADSTKMKKRSMFTFATFDEIDTLIIDTKYKSFDPKELQCHGTNVILA